MVTPHKGRQVAVPIEGGFEVGDWISHILAKDKSTRKCVVPFGNQKESNSGIDK